MTIYVFTDSRGVKHDIKQQHLEESFRKLLKANFSMHEAHDKSLDYLLACLQLSSVSEQDLLYGNHPFQRESDLTALVAHRLMVSNQTGASND